MYFWFEPVTDFESSLQAYIIIIYIFVHGVCVHACAHVCMCVWEER